MDPQSNNNKKLNISKRRNPNKYRECHKNHAASLGAHALDGCCQYIPSPSSDPSNPSSLTCAACACHRNFHRLIVSENIDEDDDNQNNKEEEEEEEAAGSHMLLTLKTGAGVPSLVSQPEEGISVGLRRKRYRSKFTKEQKEGMMELAERVGWRLQRREEEVVEEGCRRVGVERGVFKVWMHNNKQGVMEMKSKIEKKKINILENHDEENGNIIGDNYYKGVLVNGSVSDKDGDSKTASTL